jgi:hypothetical protein
MGKPIRTTIQEASNRLSRYREEKRVSLGTGASWIRGRSLERKKLEREVIKWLYIRMVKKVRRIMDKTFWERTSPKPGIPLK